MSVVDDVKSRLDIVDVVGGYLSLQKAGRYFKAPCPFHTERTPSFIVYPDRQNWHCFGACSTGGDVISFVSRKENLDFSGALRLLAERAGVELRNDGPRREEIKTLQDANEAAALFFHSLLQNPGPARAYAEERGLDSQAVSDFQLGYAPPGWEGLKGHLLTRGFDESKLIEAGLLIEGERGGYDRFRDRLMFPIRDDRGWVVGFGGRVLPGRLDGTDNGPKYMNTPQTPIFDKGGVLYGLDRAREEIRRDGAAVIVEGYMDVIAAHQHGFRNVVASMGTALTDRQVALAERQAKQVIFALDADNAGSIAAVRDVLVVLSRATRKPTLLDKNRRPRIEQGLVCEWLVATVSEGKDPDELIRSSPEIWTGIISTAEPILDHYYSVCVGDRDLTKREDHQAIIDEMLPVIAELPSPERSIWIQKLGRGSRAAEDDMWRQVRRNAGNSRRSVPNLATDGAESKAAVAPRRPAARSKEEFCLALLFKAPHLAELGAALAEELFSLSENQELFRRWRAGESISEAEEGLWEHLQAVLQTQTPQIEIGKALEAFLNCVAALEQSRMRAVKEASALALAEGEAGVRPGQIAAIARARMETGRSEEPQEDDAEVNAVSLLLEDTDVGLRLFNRRLSEDDQPYEAETR